MWKLCRSCGDLPAAVDGLLRACATRASRRDVMPDGPDLAPVRRVSRPAIGSHLKATSNVSIAAAPRLSISGWNLSIMTAGAVLATDARTASAAAKKAALPQDCTPAPEQSLPDHPGQHIEQPQAHPAFDKAHATATAQNGICRLSPTWSVSRRPLMNRQLGGSIRLPAAERPDED
jgi:hypothetical protein